MKLFLQAQCQEEEEDDVGGFENGEIAEMDGMILEMAGSLLGPLAKLVGGANISDVLRPIMNKIKNKLVCIYCIKVHLDLRNILPTPF